MGRSHVSPADRDYGWTPDSSALAVLESSGIAAMADSLPKRDPSAAGRPALYPDHVYVLANAVRGVYGSERRASAWLNEPKNWFKVRMHARKHWDIELLDIPPSRTTIHYNLNRLAVLNMEIRETFADLALKQAQEQGCLTGTVESMNKPPRANTIAVDGTVLKSRMRTKTLDRLQEEGKLRNPLPKTHKEGGEEGRWVSGFKELIMVVRPDNHPNSRVILDCFPVPKEGYGGEGGVMVERVTKLRKKTSGLLGLRCDGVATGTHIDTIMKLGISITSPVPKSDKRRVLKNVVCKAGHTHTLYTEGGDIIELERLNTGAAHPLPCERIHQFSRKNADGSYRWYANLKLVCEERHLERLDCTVEDRKKGFNRTQVIRMHPPESDEYLDTYGWRQDVESVNNNLDTTLYRHRMIVDTVEKQGLVMIGFAMARNAISEKVFKERQKRGSLAA